MRIIRGKYGRRRFTVPTNITARPTTDFARENIFNVLENMLDMEGLNVLDLFAGTGAISFEFLSRGASHVTSVEKSATQYRFIRSVLAQLGDKNMTVIRGDALRFIDATTATFDLIFADPPYAMPGFAEIPNKILNSRMVKPSTTVVVEHSKDHDFSALPGFQSRRTYGSVNFSIFIVGADADTADQPTDTNNDN